ncbi:MAG: ribonuclease HII [Candidatus Yanofskybacteria bacterium RIFCSPHIGHO2_01_FULL_45_42]|uniref:Ribonuclease HII n=3 Tax=Candidatus Yanofskyibacteriota TaxID=1752733 RepID=A0A1F8F7S3_9BACT|nr:MAG: ribonuclease HII [Candidatus Yanofskybacteria bacterium RIFCSPHIGHO2_01_FULL_45_42]OGN16387.1 MAG: ribonuclease HII [Candidatus Yanofskybacteria bacterium RIFCSPHIGHO2_02_FULL_46_19]OGN27060.1 MAG: ribonuclease HII [Candidatus Yanofskybacteria bacterium RIFCSPLOWO2_01_FULL_45_72]OGN32362.1 MAG: ribonuclease HII [Candidatus Yanofskybacteria bacterium RIFCSPLOWO2_02_FULL_45_18]
MRFPNKTLEKQLFKSGYQLVVGVDEVGTGSLAGPVVVCAVAMTNTFYNKHHKKLRRLRDSKLLLPHQREKFSKQLIRESNLAYAIASASPKVVDKINVYQAARRAMKRAIVALRPIQGNKYCRTIVLIDGKTKINGLELEQMPIVKGDCKVFAIACASVIAKVHRDKMMVCYAKRYPGYGFERHKGYGTKYHQAQLLKQGPCAIHRESFAPVAKLI